MFGIQFGLALRLGLLDVLFLGAAAICIFTLVRLVRHITRWD